MLELFKSTIYRQVMFAEFERDMHALRENGEVLTHEVLCKNYLELNKLYFGDDVVVDPLIQYELHFLVLQIQFHQYTWKQSYNHKD